MFFLIKIIKSSFIALKQTIDHDGLEHAGYMSFMVLLCLFPFIVFFLSVTSFFGASDLGKEFLRFLLQHLPSDATEILKFRINEIMDAPPPSLLTLAVLGTIWTASSFVEGVRTILNRVYMVKAPPPYIFRRILSILQFFVLILLLFVATTLLIFAPIVFSKMPDLNNIIQLYSPLTYYSSNLLLIFSLFFCISMLYYLIPNIRISFAQVIPGAAITVGLWMALANYFFKYFLYYTQLSLIYGSLGNIIITLLFFYIINIIFIYGAEFNYCYYNYNKDKK